MMYDYHKISPFTLTYASALKIKKLDFIGAVDLSKKKEIYSKNLNLNR